jgi:hypothetical protein
MPHTQVARLARLAAISGLVAVSLAATLSSAFAVSAFSPCVRAKAWAQNPYDYNVRTAGVSAASRLANAIRLREACEHTAPPHRRYYYWD